ncbi:MAG TPA: glycosyltransferase family 39 protein [Candidatus Sumerlaeota bacterium]|nr:glycosyltransferase family 39 protein [Candidatus Sumerlaeota bacterium]
MPETSTDQIAPKTPEVSPPPRTPGDGTLLLTLMGVHTLLRLALLNVNQGEYTDGILQLTQFERTDSFWPPLYTALVWLPRLCGLEALTAGRLVSVAASVALLPALWRTARTWAGRRSALFAGILYTVSPVVMRWSIRVMTDMTFVCLFQWACAAVLLLWSRGNTQNPSESALSPSSPAVKRNGQEPLRQRPGLTLTGLTLLSVLATLTRYQGLLLAPVVAVTFVALWLGRLPAARGQRHRPWGALAAQLTWLALPAWLLFQRFGHIQQVANRVPPGDLWTVVTTYWGRFEMFLYLTPYILTLPVFVFFMAGLLTKPASAQTKEATSPLPLRRFFLYCSVCVLVAQTAFLSFQERYLLPLLPFAFICAGAGMARSEEALTQWGKRGHTVFQALVLLTVCWSFGFGLLAIALQRGAFADLYDAGHYLRSLTDLPPDTRIYTTESYGPNPGMEGIHLAFVSGRKALPLLGKTGDLAQMAPGSLVVIDSRSIQGWDPSAPPTDPAQGFGRYQNFIQYLKTRYNLKLLRDAEFTHSTIPLLPDIMGAGGEQSETAWLARYQQQMFKTCIFVVEAKP